MFKTLYLNNRFFIFLIGVVMCLIISYIFPVFLPLTQAALGLILALLLIDIVILYREKTGLEGSRNAADRFSNGDENEVRIHLHNRYGFTVKTLIIDELPFQFQRRDVAFHSKIESGHDSTIVYTLRPVKRGEYHFGSINVQVSSPLGLAARRYSFSANKIIPVYPSYIQLRKYDLKAIHNNLMELGIKKIRKIGHNQEFAQIKEYVSGDDIRTINWKATARRNALMVNHYEDEKSQQVYSIIDKGRVMRMPFEGMSLMDYAINAALVISNIAIHKDDKAGLLTFNHKMGAMLKAAKTGNQMNQIMEVLYNQKTSYKESDYETLYFQIRKNITQRSLLLLYTNFESLSSLERQLPYLLKMAAQHLLVVIFFENTELQTFTKKEADTAEEIYTKAIAEKFESDKRRIVAELRRRGIYAVLTAPQNLTANTINKYLELKARGLI